MKNQSLDFENMGIYDLRNYARSIGVISPTKFRRDELIEKITAIIMGEAPEKKKTNKGRPPKHKINEQSKLDYILPNNLFDNTDPRYQDYQNNVVFKSGFTDVMCENSESETSAILYDGYYKPFDNNYGFVLKKGYLSKYYKENVIILNELADKYNLKEGDYLCGASCYLKNKNLMLVTSVLTINEKTAQQIDKNQTDEMPKMVKPKSKIVLDSNSLIDFTVIDKICPIVKGTRVLLDFEDKDQVKNTVISMVNSLTNQNNIKTFLFTIDDLPEEIYDIEYKCPEIELVNYGFDMDRQNYLDMANLKIKHIQRLVEDGCDVALICYNCNNYKNDIANNAVINDGISQESSIAFAQNKLKDIFCLARSMQTGTLTTIFINDSSKSLVNVCNTYIYFNAQKLPETDLTVDALASFTRNMQDIITDAELNKFRQFKLGLSKNNVLEKLNQLFEDNN